MNLKPLDPLLLKKQKSLSFFKKSYKCKIKQRVKYSFTSIKFTCSSPSHQPLGLFLRTWINWPGCRDSCSGPVAVQLAITEAISEKITLSVLAKNTLKKKKVQNIPASLLQNYSMSKIVQCVIFIISGVIQTGIIVIFNYNVLVDVSFSLFQVSRSFSKEVKREFLRMSYQCP